MIDSIYYQDKEELRLKLMIAKVNEVVESAHFNEQAIIESINLDLLRDEELDLVSKELVDIDNLHQSINNSLMWIISTMLDNARDLASRVIDISTNSSDDIKEVGSDELLSG